MWLPFLAGQIHRIARTIEEESTIRESAKKTSLFGTSLLIYKFAWQINVHFHLLAHDSSKFLRPKMAIIIAEGAIPGGGVKETEGRQNVIERLMMSGSTFNDHVDS